MKSLVALSFLASIGLPSCNKPEKPEPLAKASAAAASTTATGSSASAPSAATPPATKPPAQPAEPPPANLTPSDKPPFEAVVFRRNGQTNATGWPEFDAYNLGKKPVVWFNVYVYAYDKDGQQVGRTKPMSYNGKLAPGKKDSFDPGKFEKAPENAASFEICCSAVTVEGDPKGVRDPNRCPDQREKSK